MTMPHERTKAVLQTRDFLIELTRDASLPERVRQDAKFLLRHFPDKDDMYKAALIEQRTEAFAQSLPPVFAASSVD
jgi:hypothetical protein